MIVEKPSKSELDNVIIGYVMNAMTSGKKIPLLIPKHVS